MMHMRGRTRLVAAVATVGVTLATISTTALQAAHADPLPLGPSVIRTGTAPTGYEVTFNLSAPSATTVEIYGEWSFAAPVAPGSDTLAAPHGPSAWAPGDVLSGGAWWSDSMTDADLDGVWTVTMPLPPGAYSYGFYVDCPSHPGSCRVTDPANLPWSNQPAQIAASAAQQTMSQVFVPRDPQFADDDVAYLEPHSGPGGSLTEFTYSSPGATAPVGTHRAVVYTPPGYDPNRSLPYPTIYVSHGGSGNETDWVTQGQADVIVDNAIKSGRLQPSLAVFTDFNGLPNGVDGYRNDVIRNLIPAIEGAYNVSSDPASRAIAGLSAGSQRVINIIENEPAVFDYYGPWSSGGNPGAAVLTDQVKADMAGIAEIYSGVGFQDNEPSRPRADYLAERMGSYRDQIPGLKVTEHYIPGVHSWDVWRQLLNGFLRDSVFRATTVQASTPVATVATGAPVALNANVAAWTASTSVPTGTVAFYANGDATTGDKVGEGTLQSDGTVVATGRFTQVGSAVPVVAIYGGDDAHESAAAAPFTINVVPANSSGGLALGANVRYTGQAPTGYEVTFRYEAPDSVSSVAIFGEWYFSDPASIVSQATADMRLGADWREGDVLSGRNNSWRAEPMAKGTDGIWEFTTALPSGTFSYRFYHNCIPQAPNFTCSGSGYVDPTNIPWSNTAANQTAGANQQSLSQVYVPSSVRYPTYDNDYQAPALSGQEGTVQTFRYYSWQTRAIRNVSVYLPAEYDPNRPVPYPTLYLEAGGAGVGTDWLTQGVAQNIVGNAIRSGTVQPMVVVTPNTTGLPAGNPNGTQFIPEMRESVIPAIERDFNVSTDPADRALAGLSMGGARTAYTLQHSTDLFGYYGIWSPGGAYTDVPDATQGAEMAKALGIQIAAGQQDYLSDIRTETVRRIADYRALGVEVTERLVPGIHSWDFWRSTLDVFLSDMAFKKTVTEVSPVTGARAWLPVTLSATVTSLSTTALAPSGTVAFHLGSATGEKLGEAPVGANGVASVSTVVRAAGTVPVVAVYSGDAVLNGSTSDPTDIAVAAGPNNPLRLGPTVSHTGSAPTGYEVTFRYQAPDSVSSVQIYGEWYFSQPASVVSQTTSDMRMGANWQSGDILAGYSNAWRAVQMAKGTDGIWEFTTPLPSGTFSYRYYHNCSAVNGSGCAAIVDPNNLPWSNRTAQIAAGAAPQALSQVYVPSSPEYPTYDNDFQAPLAVGHEGALTSLRYHSTATGTTRNVSVWVPEGYDANRAIPYPTLYISHGAGGSDTDWMTQGMAQNIVGNAIAGGFAQDMVVVASNFNGLPGGNVGLAQDIRDSIIPAIEGQYNVSHEAKDRAFAGLSAGGARAASALHETTDVFGYYGIWSPAGAYTAPTAEQLSKMREVLGLQIGAGVQDYLGNINTGTQNRINAYRALGLEVVERMIPGIHSWDYWRGALDEFVKDVAFMTTGVHVNPVAGAKAWLPVTLSATVSPRSTAAAAPTGTVAFYVGSPDGEKLGEAQVGSDGTATISTVFSMFGLVPVVAVYSGDALLNGSTSESTSVMVAAGPSNPLRLGPTVKRTGTAPTGYEVTFRYQAPDSVASVQIYGEWYFSQPSSIVSQTTSDMRMGADWQSGDILAGYNNAWRAVQMTKGTDGIWEYTTPLPSGTFSYRFYHDCAAVNGSGCQARLDPANTPWSNETAQVAAGASQQTLSQVYVPQSTEYPTYDNDYQAPLPAGHEGTLTSLRYYSYATSGMRNVSVWLPEGYDANRATPYPTFYISHGGGGNDTDWMTQGMVQNIVGNAIRNGYAQDMVVVAPNFNGLPGGNVGLAQEIRDSIVPMVERQYNVSREAKDRALAGLSMGGARAVSALHEATDVFGYYAIWSPAGAYVAPTDEQLSRMREVLGLQIGAGVQDYLGNINTGTQNRINEYRALGLEVVDRMIPGIHSWDYWRGALDEFVKDVAFKKTATEITPVIGAKAWLPVTLSATVASLSTSAVAPTGTVTFYVGSSSGEKLGVGQVAADGAATISTLLREVGPATIVAVYSGDELAGGSVGELAIDVASGPVNPLRLGPTVARTDTAPTGHEVTFRYQAPTGIELVRIYGEWSFTNPASMAANNYVADYRAGANWRPGDVPAGTGWNGGWPTWDMTLVDAQNRIWEFTTPLPAGTFSYRYSVCTGAGGTGCTNATDPANVPWSNTAAGAGSSAQSLSQVYVPESSAFPSEDLSFQAPPAAADRGTLSPVTYESSLSGGARKAVVWLPPNYDPARAEPYPTLYLSHGGGGNETDWATQGVAQNILANAIADGRAKDMVLVLVTYVSLTGGNADASAILLGTELKDSLIPWIESHYNVSTRMEDRALAGLSQGGMAVSESVATNPGLVGYVGVWSPKDDPNAAIGGTDLYNLTEEENGPGLRSPLVIQLGAGTNDRRSQPANFPGPGAVAPILADTYRSLGANVIEQYREGVHSWDVWRWLLNEFISSVAFKDATPPAPVHLGPTVSYTGEAPTGYEVTFRYEAPDSVSSVRIKGEWSFGNADGIAADQTNPNPHYGSTWEAGDFPLSAPNVGSAANWPVADLVKNPTTGVWEYTTQLPAGTYTYAFYLNCNGNAPSLSGCSAQSDPANPPWSTAGSSEPNSQVYVPTGGEFDTGDLSWQDPNGAVGKGTVTHVIYGSPGHTNPNGVNYATIYTPPGYDPAGGVEYPTFYLVHGGGGNEMDWSTQGAAKAILDNLISSGQAQPMVVVMPNNPTTADLLGNLIPYVESHYAVSTDPQWRAYAGLSGGATTVQDILFHRTSTFGYYAVWSAPRGAPTQAEAANPALKELLGLQVGVAIQDLGGAAQANTTLEQQLLDDAGVSYRKYNTNGGHNWAWWREAMGDFVTEVAFRDAGVTVAAPAGVRQNALTTVRATVAPLAASVVPTGTVTFTADGAVLGVADIAADGVAAVSVVFPQSGSVELKAAYSGDALFDPAETTSAITVAAGNPNPLNLGPTIRYTGTGPTGYAATIRYQAPAGVTSVSIYGEWAFAQPEDIRSKFDADWHMGDDWRPGDTVGQAGVWPSTPMVQGPDGVWEYTTALPAGVFSYGFLHNCQTQGGSCMQQPDPYNVPWSNLPGMADLGVAAQRMSQIVVPTSTLFPTPDFSFAQAVATGTGGTLVPIRYNSPASTSPAGQHNLVVYLPPGYDQSRAKPYPTLYLSHGGSGSESDWATQGLAQNILDNAINSGAAEPMVVVMPNFNGLPNGNSGLYQEIRDNVIPLIEARYNVSTSPDDRAMAGLSAGGARTAMALHEQASLFEYYGIWSGGGFYAPPADNQWSAMTQVTAVHISTGTEDWQNYPINEQSYLRAADYAEHGVPVVEWNVHGIHSWDVWRQDLNDFIRNVVFQGAPTAPVAPVTTPVVSHTGVGPTGYEVTVRLYAPGADQVEIYGEWAFTQADGTSLAPSHDGNGWVPGEIPAGGSWWWASMTDPDGDGVWTYTVPLPPGVFSYGLYVDCPARTLSCRIADPSNVPWANGDVPQAAGATTQVMSQVYVPTDPEFSSEDYSYQAVRVGPKGVLTALRYFSPESTSPVGSHQAVVYTPPGYDPDRVEPYPTLYLSHGGGGNETDWAAQGRANVILDNAINAGEAAPMVVVMTNFNGLPNGNDGYRADLIGRVIPAIEAAYNVSTDPADRAFAGLSAGGSRAFNILLSQAEEFGYFGIWSSGGSAPDLTADQVAKIRGLGGIQFSAGLNENAGLTMPVRAAEYEAAVPGLDIAEYYVPGVHAWAVWRQSLNDFIRNHAFKDTPDQPTTPVTSQALEALANVAGALNEDLYTQASWAALQGAVSSAQAALSNPNATQGDIDAAAAALSGAIAGLIPAPTAPPGSGAGDSGPLSALVTGVSTLRAESYSQATWAALQAALTGARAVTANPASTQAELNAALAALNAALAALAPAPTPAPTQSSPAPSEPGVVDPGPVVDAAATLAAKTALGSVVTQAESLVSGGYTAESWAALQTVLSAAKAIGGDPAAGAAQAQAAIVQLSKALAGLVAQAPAPVTGPEGSVATVSLVKAGQRAVVLAKGQKITIAALAYTDTGAKATVRWSSSAKSVATVSSTGMITAKKAGKATITIRAGAKNTTLKVTVLAKKPSATVKKVTATVPKTLRVGDSGTVIPTYSPARVAKVKVTYTSANPDVVSVDKTGRLLAKQAGTAKISVKAGGKTKVYTVVVS